MNNQLHISSLPVRLLDVSVVKVTHKHDQKALQELWYDVTFEYQKYISSQQQLLQFYDESQDPQYLFDFLEERENFLSGKISYQPIFPQEHFVPSVNTTTVWVKKDVENIVDISWKQQFLVEWILLFWAAVWSIIVVKNYDKILTFLQKIYSKNIHETGEGDISQDENIWKEKCEEIWDWIQQFSEKLTQKKNISNYDYLVLEHNSLSQEVEELYIEYENDLIEIVDFPHFKELYEKFSLMRKQFKVFQKNYEEFLEKKQEKLNTIDMFLKDGVVYQTIWVEEKQIEAQEIMVMTSTWETIYASKTHFFELQNLDDVQSLESIDFEQVQSLFERQKAPFYFSEEYTLDEVLVFCDTLQKYVKKIEHYKEENLWEMIDILKKTLLFLGIKRINVYNAKDFKKILLKIHPDKHSYKQDFFLQEALSEITKHINMIHDLIKKDEYATYFKMEIDNDDE